MSLDNASQERKMLLPYGARIVFFLARGESRLGHGSANRSEIAAAPIRFGIARGAHDPPFLARSKPCRLLWIFLFLCGAAFTHAQQIDLLSDVANGGGGPGKDVTGTIIVDISVGNVLAGPVSDVSAIGAQTKVNLIGRFYDLAGLRLSPLSNTLVEGTSLQIDAQQRMDDDTALPLADTEVSWNVVSGPVTVSPSGLVTAGLVAVHTPASIGGTWLSFSDTIALTILDIATKYSEWRVANFAPSDLNDDGKEATVWGDSASPDGDGSSNIVQFLTGGDPNVFEDNPPFTVSTVVEGGTEYLTISFRRRIDTELTGVTFSVQFSSERTAGYVESSKLPTTTGPLPSPDEIFEDVVYEDDVPITSGSPRFVKVIITPI